MRIRLLTIVLLLLPPQLKAQAPSIVGTYAVWFCAAACEVADTAAAPVKGYLVLDSDTLHTLTLPEAAREELAEKSTRLLWVSPAVGRVAPHACFALSGPLSAVHLFMTPTNGLTEWGRETEATIAVRLAASPDAFHTLKAGVEGGRLNGVVRFHGFIGREFDEQRGSVHGVLLSPPDLSRCAPS